MIVEQAFDPGAEVAIATTILVEHNVALDLGRFVKCEQEDFPLQCSMIGFLDYCFFWGNTEPEGETRQEFSPILRKSAVGDDGPISRSIDSATQQGMMADATLLNRRVPTDSGERPSQAPACRIPHRTMSPSESSFSEPWISLILWNASATSNRNVKGTMFCAIASSACSITRVARIPR